MSIYENIHEVDQLQDYATAHVMDPRRIFMLVKPALGLRAMANALVE